MGVKEGAVVRCDERVAIGHQDEDSAVNQARAAVAVDGAARLHRERGEVRDVEQRGVRDVQLRDPGGKLAQSHLRCCEAKKDRNMAYLRGTRGRSRGVVQTGADLLSWRLPLEVKELAGQRERRRTIMGDSRQRLVCDYRSIGCVRDVETGEVLPLDLRIRGRTRQDPRGYLRPLHRLSDDRVEPLLRTALDMSLG